MIIECKTNAEWEVIFNHYKANQPENNQRDWDQGVWMLWPTAEVGLGSPLGFCISIKNNYFHAFGIIDDYKGEQILSFTEWKDKNTQTIKKQSMKKLMLDVLEKTYNDSILRSTTVPLFMSNPGVGKSSIVKEYANNIGVGFKKITLSQRMPNEVVGGMMPNETTKTWEVYDSEELKQLKDGDILFFDEVFNGTLKQTLDAVLNLLEDRTLPSGRKLANVMIIAASNPQGLINLTPQIKERFIRYDLKFDREDFQTYLTNLFGVPLKISHLICSLIEKEKFEHESWNYMSPRSVVKALHQIRAGLESPYDDLLIPILLEKIAFKEDLPALNLKADEEVAFLDVLKLFTKK